MRAQHTKHGNIDICSKTADKKKHRQTEMRMNTDRNTEKEEDWESLWGRGHIQLLLFLPLHVGAALLAQHPIDGGPLGTGNPVLSVKGFQLHHDRL